jgi:N-acetylneuraminic acid mutarotase
MNAQSRSCLSRTFGRSTSAKIVVAVASVTALLVPTGSASASETSSVARTAAHQDGASRWVERPALRQARLGHDVATVQGHIYAIAGFAGNDLFRSVEARRVRGHGRWQSVAPLAVARANLATAALDGIIYAAGGNADDQALDVVEKFDPDVGSWRPSPRLPQPRDGAGAAALGGLLYVAGGFVVDDDGNGQVTDSMVAFNPRTRTWRTMAPMHHPRERLRLVTAGQHLYAIGGFSPSTDPNSFGTPVSTVERYSPRSNTWQTVASMNRARALPGVVALRRGSKQFIVVVAGGDLVGGNRIFLRSTEIYDLQTGRWRLIRAELPQGRVSLVSAKEADGTVLAIGGAAGTDLADAQPTAKVHALRLTNLDLADR